MQDFIKLRPLFMVFNWLYRRKIYCHFAKIVSHFADTVSQTELVTNLTCTFSFQYRRCHADADSGTQRLGSSKRPPGAKTGTWSPCHAGQTRGGSSPEPTLPAPTWSVFCTPSTPTLGSSLASWPSLVSPTTISMFVCFVLSNTLSIRVEGSSTSPFISCSSKFTSLSAIALTKSIGVLYTTDCCPVWSYLFNLGPHPTTETTLWQKSGL